MIRYGELAWLFSLLILLTALNWVRRNLFEVFFYSHRILLVLFYVFSILHTEALYIDTKERSEEVDKRGHMLGFCSLGMVLFAIDAVIRVYIGRIRKTTTVSIASAQNTKSNKITRICVKKE